MQSRGTPTRSELRKKLYAAMDALKAGRRSIADGVNNPHVELDMEQHGLSSLKGILAAHF